MSWEKKKFVFLLNSISRKCERKIDAKKISPLKLIFLASGYDIIFLSHVRMCLCFIILCTFYRIELINFLAFLLSVFLLNDFQRNLYEWIFLHNNIYIMWYKWAVKWNVKIYKFSTSATVYFIFVWNENLKRPK